MRCGHRKSTPQVIKGEVQKKNNRRPSFDYYIAPQPRAVIVDRKRPGEGYRHILNKNDIYRFLEILPDWNGLAVGLNAIVLAPGDPGTHGYHVQGVVHICAWETDFWREASPLYYKAHQELFARLGVDCEPIDDGYTLCKFEESSIRAFQLLHILLHELGHHHDRMTTRSQHGTARGETYAEAYAFQHEAAIWDQYYQLFSW